MKKETKNLKENVLIADGKKLEQKLKLFKEQGPVKLHVLTDFDRTLSQAFVCGQKSPSLIAQIRNENFLSEEYSKQAHALYDRYHHVEIDPGIPQTEKMAQMHEWWHKHFQLLINSRLTKRILAEVVAKKTIQLRPGVEQFLQTLNQQNIPVVIMSASLGDMIALYLKQIGQLNSNIHIIANNFNFDAQGKVLSVQEPIIHSLNKKEILVKDFPAFQEIKSRKNVLLLGDSLEDPEMINGFDFDNLIKIGFLNENVEANLPHYKKEFDIIILNDPDFSYINALLKQITDAN